MKPRIAFVCDAIAEFTAGSIVSTRRFSLLLKERGHHIIFIAGHAPGHRTHDTWEGMPVYRFVSFLLPKTDGNMYLGFPTIGQVTRILQDEKIDLLHVVVPTPAAVAAVYAARQLKIPIVVHSHTQPENLFLNAMHNRAVWFSNFLSALMYVYLHWLYTKVSIIIFPSEFSRRLFKALPKNMPTAVVSNGVATERYAPRNPSPILKKFNLPQDRSYLLYVGRLHPEKQVHVLIRAIPSILATNPNAHLLIVGTGHREPALKALTKKLNIEHAVTFLGYLSEEDVEAIYSAANLFVLPSLVELEGMVVLQAMAAGVALLIADSPKSASPRLVEGNGLLFTPGDSADLSRKALEILGDSARLAAMKERSLSLSRKFDIQASVDTIEGIYESLLAHSAPKPR